MDVANICDFSVENFLFYVQPLQAQPYQFHFCLFKSKKENERKFIKFYNCWSLNEDEKRSTMTNFCWRKEHEESKNFLIPSCLLPEVWEIPEKIQFERIQLSMQCGSETESMMIRKYPFISHSIHFRLLIQFSIATMFLFSSAINGNLSLTYVHEFNLGTTCAKKIQKLTNCGKTPEVLLTYELKF